MPSNVNSILALIFCFSGFTDAIAASSNSSEATGRIAEARDSWLAAFKSKDVGAAVVFYASDAAFLQPSGDRIEGIEAICELYQKIVSTFETNLAMRSRNLEVSAGLAYDSGEYEETLTNRTTGEKQHFRGQYLMIFRLSSNGHWRIIQHAWTVAPNRSNQSLAGARMTSSQHIYEVRRRKDHRGVDLISDALPFGRLWYGEPNAVSNAVGYAKHRCRSHDAVIRVYDDAGNDRM